MDQRLRPGSIVRRFNYVPYDERHSDGHQQYGPRGVVFNVEIGEDGEGDEVITAVDVRWIDGRTERIVKGEPNTDYRYGQPVECQIDDVTPELHVNVYLTDRAYGGGEEGGWWYDTGEFQPDLSAVATSRKEAERLLAAKRAEIEGMNEGRPPVSSVLSQGIYEVRLEAWPGEDYPSRVPYYC